MCAVLLYSLLDDDKSATIDTTEMFCVLREMFSEFMDDSQIVALTDYLMTTVGQQQGTVRLSPSPSAVHARSAMHERHGLRRPMAHRD